MFNKMNKKKNNEAKSVLELSRYDVIDRCDAILDRCFGTDRDPNSM